MKRRDVIKLGAVAAGTTAGVPGCGVPRMFGEQGAKEFTAMLDEQTAGLDKPGLLFRLVERYAGGKLPEHARTELAAQDKLFRELLGALMITQSFRDLDKETQAQPAVQERMWQHMDQIAGVGVQVSDMLAALDPEQQRRLQNTLKAKPDLPMQLAESVDERAGRAGISSKRRMQWRKLMMQTGFRLKHNHPGILIDEYVDKVERLQATTDRDAAVLDVAGRLGDREYWRQQRRLAQDPDPGATVPAPPAPSPTPPAKPADSVAMQYHQTILRAAKRGDCVTVDSLLATVRDIDPEYHRVILTDPVVYGCRQLAPPAPLALQAPPMPTVRPGTKGLRVGGYLFGIGLATGLVSILLVSSGGDGGLAVLGLFGLTAGVVLVAIGLLVLFFSALVYLVN